MPVVFLCHLVGPLDVDFWWHLRSGQWMWQHFSFLRADPFSSTMRGQPWVNFEWLFQALLYPAYAAGGLWGTTALMMTVGGAAFAMLFAVCRRGMPLWMAAWAMLIAAVVARDRLVFRPELFTMLCGAAALWIWERAAAGKRSTLWGYPPLLCAWANLHGGFVLGLALLGIYCAASAATAGLRARGAVQWQPLFRREDGPFLGGIAGLSLLACCVNPYGVELFAEVARQMRPSLAQGMVGEWLPLAQAEFAAGHLSVQLYRALFWGGSAVFLLGWRQWNLAHVLFWAALAYLSHNHLRFMALFGFLGTPLLGRMLTALLPAATERLRRGAAATAIGAAMMWMILFVTGRLYWGDGVPMMAGVGADEIWYPVRATQWLRQQPAADGAMFNDYNSGSFLIWALPDHRVFVDGRNQLYGDAFLEQYLAALGSSEEWRALRDRHRLTWAFLDAQLGPTQLFRRRLREEEGWRLMWVDSACVILASPEQAARGQRRVEAGASLPTRSGMRSWREARELQWRLRLAEALFGLRRYAEAEEHLQAALNLRPRRPVAANIWGNLASIALEQGDERSGRQRLQAALALNPRDPTALLLLAETETERGDFTTALKLIATAIRHSPPRPELFQQQSRTASRAGDHDLAVRSARRALAAAPVRTAPFQVTLADALLAAQRRAEARRAYEEALQLPLLLPSLRAHVQRQLLTLETPPQPP